MEGVVGINSPSSEEDMVKDMEKQLNIYNDVEERNEPSERKTSVWETLRTKVKNKEEYFEELSRLQENTNNKSDVSDILKKEDDIDLVEALVTAISDVKGEIDEVKEARESSIRAKALWQSVKSKVDNNEIQHIDEEESNFCEQESNFCEQDLKEVQDMVILLSAQGERGHRRRAGMSERNEIERMLVQKTLENLVKIRNTKEMTHV